MKCIVLCPLALVVLLLSGCLTTSIEPLDQQQRSRFQTVAVRADFPELAMQKTGTTAFNNVLFRVPDTAEETNAEAERLTVALLRENGFDLRSDEGMAPHAWRDLEIKAWSPGYDFSEEQLRILSDLNASGVDALILIKGQSTTDTIAGSNQTLAGHGLYHRSFLNMNATHAFIGMRIIMLSTADGSKIIAAGESGSEAMPDTPFPPDLEAVDPRLLEEIRTITHSLLSEMIPDVLARMGLVSAPSRSE